MSTKRYVCSECKNSDKIMCKHLSKLMPRGSQQSIRAILVEDIQKVKTTENVYNINERLVYFRDKLLSYGLEPIRVEVLTLRFVMNCSLYEIAEILSIPTEDRPSKAVVYRIYKQSLELLKERGYKLGE